MKFEKKLELGIEIVGYEIEGSNYKFIIEFDRELKTDEGITFTKMKQPEYNLERGEWIRDEMPRLLEKDDCYGIDLFEEVDHVLFTSLFGDEKHFKEIIYEMIIEYAKNKKLPVYLKEVREEDVDILYRAEEIMKDIGEKNIYRSYGHDIPYFKEIYILKEDSIILRSEIFEKEYYLPNGKHNIDIEFINTICDDFHRNWNKDMIGKFDWFVYEAYKSLNNK
jgi:hypothetical protein